MSLFFSQTSIEYYKKKLFKYTCYFIIISKITHHLKRNIQKSLLGYIILLSLIHLNSVVEYIPPFWDTFLTYVSRCVLMYMNVLSFLIHPFSLGYTSHIYIQKSLLSWLHLSHIYSEVQ